MVAAGFSLRKKMDIKEKRTYESIAVQVRYILDNPVRRGLVSSWEKYPFKGSIGCKLEDVLRGII